MLRSFSLICSSVYVSAHMKEKSNMLGGYISSYLLARNIDVTPVSCSCSFGIFCN